MIVPKIVVFVYFLLLINALITPIWVNELEITYPKALLPTQCM